MWQRPMYRRKMRILCANCLRDPKDIDSVCEEAFYLFQTIDDYITENDTSYNPETQTFICPDCQHRLKPNTETKKED